MREFAGRRETAPRHIQSGSTNPIRKLIMKPIPFIEGHIGMPETVCTVESSKRVGNRREFIQDRPDHDEIHDV